MPEGFAIDSFEPDAGWNAPSSERLRRGAVIQKITWTGGKHAARARTPTSASSASLESTQDYEFEVRQTYSDGKVVDWNGSESSDTPAPVVEAKLRPRRRRRARR